VWRVSRVKIVALDLMIGEIDIGVYTVNDFLLRCSKARFDRCVSSREEVIRFAGGFLSAEGGSWIVTAVLAKVIAFEMWEMPLAPMRQDLPTLR